MAGGLCKQRIGNWRAKRLPREDDPWGEQPQTDGTRSGMFMPSHLATAVALRKRGN
jgi:hypothetical protein